MGHFSLESLLHAAHRSARFGLRAVLLTTFKLNLKWLQQSCPFLFAWPADEGTRPPIEVCILHHSFQPKIFSRMSPSPSPSACGAGATGSDGAIPACARAAAGAANRAHWLHSHGRDFFMLNPAYTRAKRRAAAAAAADSQGSGGGAGAAASGAHALPPRHSWSVLDVPPHVRIVNVPPTLPCGRRARGVQHSKMAVLVGTAELIIVVSSANLGPQRTVDMSWVQRFPRRRAHPRSCQHQRPSHELAAISPPGTS